MNGKGGEGGMNGEGGEGGREGGREGRGAVCQRKNESRPFLLTISPRKEPTLLSSSSFPFLGTKCPPEGGRGGREEERKGGGVAE
jgi:hypothetical protein